MTSKQIKCLRHKIEHFVTFEIYNLPLSRTLEPYLLFKVKAANPEQALLRYFKWYRRSHKERSELENGTPVETSRSFGSAMVINTKTGFKHYFF